jgi:diguanylate cyclase (GGDEF)-like protein
VYSEKELQLLFYKIVIELFRRNDIDEFIIPRILGRVSEWLDLDYFALYVYLEQSGSHRLLGYFSKRNNSQPVRFVKRKEIQPHYFIEGENRDTNASLLSIQLDDLESMVFVYKCNHTMSEEFLSLLKKEIKKLFTIVERTLRNIQKTKNSNFLLNTSSKLLNAEDKQHVLQEMIAALQEFYRGKEYSYHLILIQDDQVIKGIPTKPLQLGNEQSIPLSTKVFMSGDMQVEMDEDKRVKSIYAPLIGEQSVYGVLEITAPIESYQTKEEMEFIRDFAALSGKALEKTILYEDSLKEVNKLTLLNKIIHNVNATKELKELTKLIKLEIKKITGAKEVGFIYFDEHSEDDVEILTGSTPYFHTEAGRKLIITYKDEMAESNEAIFTGNALDPAPGGFRSVMAIPMVYSGLSLGFTIILHEEAYHFTFEDFKLMESFIEHSSLALSNTMLRERLQLTVITDYLTQLYTRGYLEAELDRHLEEGERGILLLFDVDDFKEINDSYGHHVGDYVLKQVANKMKDVVGNNGTVARWGGEEFAIYLPAVTLPEGQEMADLIRKHIPLGSEPSVTVSCGIAYWERGSFDTQVELFRRADDALYKAKKSGKDRLFVL